MKTPEVHVSPVLPVAVVSRPSDTSMGAVSLSLATF